MSTIRHGKLWAGPMDAMDFYVVAHGMRTRDRVEVETFSSMDATQVLLHSVMASEFVVAVRDGDTAVALFGVAPHPENEGEGVPWLLATDGLEKHPLTFLRYCGHFVSKMAKGFRRLGNWVDSRNEASLRWLEWCGFTCDRSDPANVAHIGPGRVPFLFMERRFGDV